MKIVFYRSKLCPRCYVVQNYLRQLIAGDATIMVEEIDIFLEPKKAFAAGVRMIPAIVVGENMLSGIWLTPQKIRNFLTVSCPQNKVEKNSNSCDNSS
jgi:hypothetical protein